MWAAVNRVTNDGNVRGPEQRISPLSALKAVTLDAAYSLQMEKDVGSIEPGKLANFTILADNPLTIDPMKIKDIAVWGHRPGRSCPSGQVSRGCATRKHLEARSRLAHRQC
jgi:predicted amidohydrolase YtcJ